MCTRHLENLFSEWRAHTGKFATSMLVAYIFQFLHGPSRRARWECAGEAEHNPLPRTSVQRKFLTANYLRICLVAFLRRGNCIKCTLPAIYVARHFWWAAITQNTEKAQNSGLSPVRPAGSYRGALLCLPRITHSASYFNISRTFYKMLTKRLSKSQNPLSVSFRRVSCGCIPPW